MIKAIVFDLWNTLAHTEGGNTIRELRKELKIKNIRVLEETLMTQKFNGVEEAVINLLNHLKIKPDQITVKKLVEFWNDSRFEPHLFEDVIPILEELKKGYKLGLISNTDCFLVTFPEKEDFFNLFDAKCFSFDTGFLKPDPRVFELIIKKLEVKPSEVLMIGDNLSDDVLAAKKIGMKAILIKRECDYPLSWREKGTYKKTIKNLYELKNYLAKNG